MVAHLKAAAQQAEEVATAVLQPRLQRRAAAVGGKGGRGRGRGGGGAKALAEGGEEPEEGGSNGAVTVAVAIPMACGRTEGGGQGGQGGNGAPAPPSRGEGEEEGGHDWPFLPFERTWVAQAASYS